jgi:hypothetical protein
MREKERVLAVGDDGKTRLCVGSTCLTTRLGCFFLFHVKLFTTITTLQFTILIFDSSLGVDNYVDAL